MPKKHTVGRFAARAAMLLLSRGQRPITLEAELAHKKKSQFLKDYGQWSGGPSSWEDLSSGGHAIDCGSGKWGTEYRIYFVKDQTVKNQLERWGYQVENGDVRYPGTFRINSRELFEHLVATDGLRIGHNP
jgi:hypothetical protein